MGATQNVKFEPKIPLWGLSARAQKFNLVHRPHTEFKKSQFFGVKRALQSWHMTQTGIKLCGKPQNTSKKNCVGATKIVQFEPKIPLLSTKH